MLKGIDKDSKVLFSDEFQKDKYKFFLILQNLPSKDLLLYSDEENYIFCNGNRKFQTWVWTKDSFDKSLLNEIKEGLKLYRFEDSEAKFTCKKELYDLLKQDNYDGFGDYYFEMGYLYCTETKKPRKTDGYIELAKEEDKDLLSKFIYNESREIVDVKDLTWEESQKEFDKRLARGTYYVWKNDSGEIVSQACYSIVDGSAKVSGVYTPPRFRGKAYAANLIYVLTNRLFKKGYHVSLYTDYEYIPSNKAYQNVGYIDDDVLINFTCKSLKKQ